jgi:hypothetical protein
MSKINVVQNSRIHCRVVGVCTTLVTVSVQPTITVVALKKMEAMTQNVLHAQSFGTLLATCSEGFAGTCRECVL